MNRILVAVTAAGLLIACGDSLGPNNDEVVAALTFEVIEEFDTPEVFVPDTVRMHQQFPVVIRTYHGCRLEEGRSAVETDGLRATIIPYKSFLPSPNCPDFLAVPRRYVYMQFDERGLGTVTVIGLSTIRYPGEQADTILVMRRVVVR
ncbi:hypothetical protein [Candidatus Palauibacter sp.]|uniref:hypothetical protein n=1 Tax=Candidatus Palauibacter sp. TaxID=3101350 RepID=UPI003B51A906